MLLSYYADCDPSVESCGDDTTGGTSPVDPGSVSPDAPTQSTTGAASPALTAADVTNMKVMLATASANASQAQELADSPSSFWVNLIGADSAAAALQSNAQASEDLYAVLTAKYTIILSNPNATEDDVQKFLSAAGALPNTAAIQTADQLSAATAAQQVAKDSLNDLLNLLPKLPTLPTLPQIKNLGLYALLGVGGIVVLMVLTRRKS